MRNNILIIGAGGVGNVVAHKCAQNNDILGDICVASRTQNRCDDIIESVRRKNSLKDKNKRIYSAHIDARNIPSLVQLIRKTESFIVINVGTAFINMSVLRACLETGAAYHRGRQLG